MNSFLVQELCLLPLDGDGGADGVLVVTSGNLHKSVAHCYFML
jgi:hypothetical protein